MMGLFAARQAEMAEAVVSWLRFRSRIAMSESLAWAQRVAGSLKTGQPPAVHPQLPSGRFERICKQFRNTRPQSAVYGQDVAQPTPIFQRRLRCALVGAGLSRRRPRVRVP